MKDIISDRPLRAAVLAAALAGTAALGAAACGGNTPAPVAQQTSSRYQQAVAYSGCMRSNGDPAWPDPDKNGLFGNKNGSLDRSSAAYMTAQNACKKLEPSGAPAAGLQQQALAQFLKYSRCMRAHGISKYPDPATGAGGGVGISIQGNIGQHTPQFAAAQQACRSLQPGPGQ